MSGAQQEAAAFSGFEGSYMGDAGKLAPLMAPAP